MLTRPLFAVASEDELGCVLLLGECLHGRGLVLERPHFVSLGVERGVRTLQQVQVAHHVEHLLRAGLSPEQEDLLRAFHGLGFSGLQGALGPLRARLHHALHQHHGQLLNGPPG